MDDSPRPQGGAGPVWAFLLGYDRRQHRRGAATVTRTARLRVTFVRNSCRCRPLALIIRTLGESGFVVGPVDRHLLSGGSGRAGGPAVVPVGAGSTGGAGSSGRQRGWAAGSGRHRQRE